MPRTASVRAATPVTALSLTREAGHGEWPNGWHEFLVYLFYFDLLVWYELLQIFLDFSDLIDLQFGNVWNELKWRPGLDLSTCLERHLNEVEPACIHPSTRLARTWPQLSEKTKSRRCRGTGREEPVQVRATAMVKTRNPFVRSCSYVLITCQGCRNIQNHSIGSNCDCDDMWWHEASVA